MTRAAAEASQVLAFDVGGTKVSVGIVSSEGRIVDQAKVPVILDVGPEGFLEQIGRIGDTWLARFPLVTQVGIASAGPLDPGRGEWMSPTNFKTEGRHWGLVPVVAPLSKRWKRAVRLDNDAAAGALAEQWLGAHRERDFCVLTLGTGVGVGVIANGDLVRAGRGLHPEASHMILRVGDLSAPCGCGNFGCAEAYLSATGFSGRLNLRTGNTRSPREWVLALRSGEAEVGEAFQEYLDMMVAFVHNLCVLYAPRKIVFTGSFAESASAEILSARKQLIPLLESRRVGHDFVPEFSMSELGNDACLLGGARLALLQ